MKRQDTGAAKRNQTPATMPYTAAPNPSCTVVVVRAFRKAFFTASGSSD